METLTSLPPATAKYRTLLIATLKRSLAVLEEEGCGLEEMLAITALVGAVAQPATLKNALFDDAKLPDWKEPVEGAVGGMGAMRRSMNEMCDLLEAHKQ